MGRNDPGMETPVAPLPDEAPKRKGLRRTRSGRKQSASASAPGERGPIAAGLAYAGSVSTRVLVFIVLVQLLLALTVVIPFWSGISERLDHHPHADAIAGSATVYDNSLGWESGLHSGIWNDVKRESKSLLSSLTITHFWIAIVAWLFGAMAAGGFLGTVVSGENPVRVGSFLSHGAKWFGPMLRVGLLAGIAYYVVGRLVFEAWGETVQSSEHMSSSETSEWWGDRIREYGATLVILWVFLAADMARAELVVFGRKSAVGAFLRGLGRALRPRVWLIALAIGVPAFLVLLGLGFVAQRLMGGDAWVLVTLFLVFQIAVAVRWFARAGVLAAFTRVVR